MRDGVGRVLHRDGDLFCDRPSLVAVAGEENEAAPGPEPRGMEVQDEPRIRTSGKRNCLLSGDPERS